MKNSLIIFITLFATIFLLSCSDDIIENNELDQKQQTSNIGKISKNDAINIASQFAKTQGILPPGTRSAEHLNLEVVYTDLHLVNTRATNQTPAYYIINIGESGYIVVSASDATLPVLGYSTSGTFDSKNIPLGMQELLQNYSKEVSIIRKNNIRPDETTIKIRKQILSNGSYSETGNNVQPLLGNIKWGQKPYYNAYCPEKTPVGCVATATAQIIRYWEYPKYGEGKYSYKFNNKNLSFDYNYKLNIKEMPKQKLNSENDDIAKLYYGIAVGLNTKFSQAGSAAWQDKVPELLTKHYKYPATMKIKYKEDFSADEWKNMIKYELDAGRPIQYVAYSSAGGHSFVCDGYNENGYFHFNWGWGGASDGYFLIESLNPSMIKTTNGFDKAHSMITGIQAPKNIDNSTDESKTTPDTNYNNKYPESKAMFAITTYIKNVNFANIDNVTLSNKGGYNYFSKQTIQVNKGNKYKMYLTPGSTKGNYTEYWRAWIDFNQNGNFEENEKVAEGITRNQNPFIKKIKIDKNVLIGTTRLRVSMKWGSYPTANETFRHGEVEDYNINIK